MLFEINPLNGMNKEMEKPTGGALEGIDIVKDEITGAFMLQDQNKPVLLLDKFLQVRQSLFCIAYQLLNP